MSTSPTKKPMACLTIGYQRLLLPADKALSMMAALQQAVDVELDYAPGCDCVYKVQSTPLRCSIDLVPASKIIMPEGTAVVPRTRRIAAT